MQVKRNFRHLLELSKTAADACAHSRYAGIFLLLVFFAASSARIFNITSFYISKDVGITDEAHTLISGTEHLSPLERSVSTARVGETNRWLVRLLYPVGIYYMNSRMGGEIHLTGWEYPGGYYLRDKFESTEEIRYDPNIQDYVFSMRLTLGIITIFSFCMVLWRLFNLFGFAAAASYGALILSSQLVFWQFRFFYSETALFLIFNIAAFLCLRSGTPTHRTGAYLGILSAAALSAKLTGILIVVPAFVYMITGAYGRSRRKANFLIEAYLLFALVFLVLINLPSESIFSFINETLANIYHYKTGEVVTEKGGLEFLFRVFEHYGHFIFVLFSMSLVWLAKSPRRRLAPVYALAAIIIFVILSLVNSAVYLPRNFASVYAAMSFISALGVGFFCRELKNLKVFRACSLCAALAFAWASGSLVYGMPSLAGSFFERNVQYMKTCSSIGAIGVSEKYFQAIGKNENVVFFEQIQGDFNISENSQEIFQKYLQADCLVVYRQGQSKQITNYFAPQAYQLSDRIGDWFFFGRHRLLLLGDFEGGLDGWKLEGEALANHADHEHYRGQLSIEGNAGPGFLTSFHPDRGDEPVGRALSPEFAADPGQQLVFLLAGGRGGGVGLRLLANGEEAAVWRGKNSEQFEQVVYSLDAVAGMLLQLELFDNESGAWGHIMLDRVMVAQQPRAQEE